MAYKILTMAVLATAVFFVCRIIYAAVIALPYPQEILEPSNVALTNMFLSGSSPYSLESLETRIPGVNFDYPFLNSLVAALIAKICGCSAVTAHFILSLFSILASGAIGYHVAAKQSRTTVAPVLCALLFMICHWRYGYISASPDGFGLLLFLLTLYIPACSKIKYKPVLCAIGITLCFYTKQYYAFVAAPVFIYMFLYSKKEAVKLFAITLGINLALAAVITTEWPLYWLRTLIFAYLGAGIGGGFKFSTLISQLNYLIVSFAALFAVMVVALFLTVREYRKRSEKIRISIKENDVFAVSVINTLVMILPLSVLGRNDGAIITYFLQLWMAPIGVVALISLERIKCGRWERLFEAGYFMIAAFTIYFGFGRMPLHVLTDEEVANWQKAYEYTAKYSETGDIYYSRSLAYDGFARDNGDWMCGHDGEVSEGTNTWIETLGVSDEMVLYTRKMVDQNLSYRESIRNKAEEHGYSLVTFESGVAFSALNEELCEEYGYECIDKLDLQLGIMSYEVAFYVPGDRVKQQDSTF